MENQLDKMNVVAAAVCSTIKAGTVSGLSPEAATLAAIIGVLSYIRVDNLPEDKIFKTAKALCQ